MSEKYDVVIIGAGIGGLVCGCYLAKAGKKVLIVEKNDKPGGYCSSFERDGYRFDAGPHSLGEMYKGGRLRNVVEELSLDIEFTRIDPSDIIVTHDYEICFWNDLKKTIHGLQSSFPKEANNIENFFMFITNTRNSQLYYELRHKTFLEFLNEYFADKKIKYLLNIPLGNLGVSSKAISALVAVVLYRDFIINGGYYPKEGMISFPQALAKKLKEFGGSILFSSKVNKIKISNNKVKGIRIDEQLVESKFIVSNCDLRQTFFSLIGEDYLAKNYINKLNSLVSTPSIFLVYLGLKNTFSELGLKKCTALWYPTSDMNNVYLQDNNPESINFSGNNLLCSLSEFNVSRSTLKSMHILMMAPFKNESFWENNKHEISHNLIKRAEEIIENLSRHISLKIIATPYDLFRHTLNFNGSAYGWAAFPSQANKANFKLVTNKTEIDGLFLCGHWLTYAFGQGGISNAALSGKRVAFKILRIMR